LIWISPKEIPIGRRLDARPRAAIKAGTAWLYEGGLPSVDIAKVRDLKETRLVVGNCEGTEKLDGRRFIGRYDLQREAVGAKRNGVSLVQIREVGAAEESQA
jgi:hypothetical protein